MILMIDNYDSFTYNIYQYLSELGYNVKVVRNDATTVDDIKHIDPSYIVVSPGPCTPNEAGISVDLIREYAGLKPILGVCLGHQCIATAFGGNIINSSSIMHGKTSDIFHNNRGAFKDLPSPYTATRYHSLVIDKNSIPDCLEVTSWTTNPDNSLAEIMGIRHKDYNIEGVQFHPESIMTEHGHLLFKNFLENSLSNMTY